jgi:hypothetical protein
MGIDKQLDYKNIFFKMILKLIPNTHPQPK